MDRKALSSKATQLVEWFRYRPSPVGLIRIAGWCGFFLWLSSLAIPSLGPAVAQSGGHAVGMLLKGSDPRWIRDGFETFPTSSSPNIAWITGSSAVIRGEADRHYLPDLTVESLRDNYGLEMNAYLYLMNGRRVLDTYSMLKDAVVRRPDVMVVVINPFWDYNPKAIFYRTNLLNHATQLWWNSKDWPLQFLLASPSNHFYGAMGKKIPNFFSLARHRGLTTDLMKIDPVLKRSTAEIRRNEGPSLQPLQFWMLKGDIAPELEARLSPHWDGNRIDTLKWQSAAIGLADSRPGSWPEKLMRNMFEEITESDIPTLVYVAPISPKLSGERAVAGYETVVKAVRGLKFEYESENLKVIERFPPNVSESLLFRDYLHLADSGALHDYLSGIIYELAVKQ